MRRSTLFLLALSAFLGPSSALGAQVLAGIVRLAPSGAPAARTIVVAVGDGSRIVATRQADATGVFALELGRPGNYRLLFIRSGSESVATPTVTIDTTPYVEREFQIPGDSAAHDSVLLASQVDTPAEMLPRPYAPQYPDGEARRAIRGRVRVLFVVDPAGRVERKSVAIVGATSEGFVEPVERAVRNSRFKPASVGGQPVRQLVELTAHFGCHGDLDDGVRGDFIIHSMYPACLTGQR